MITGNPFSACLAALAVAKKTHLPLIVDYRDHWTLNNTIEQPTGWLYTMHQALERYIVKQAALITTATRTIQADLQKAFAPLPDNKFQVYYNGWDEEDFIDKYRQPGNDNHITLSYLGTLYTDRKLAALLSALKAVSTTYPKIRLRLVGNFFPETIAEVKESGIGHLVEFIPQQNHAAAIQMMLDSDLLLLVIGDAKLKWVLTGKLFEYLRSQRPILALAPGDGEAAEILNACGHSSICDINDPKAIETALLQLVAGASNNSFSFSIPHQFERKNQIKLFEEKLSCIAK
jgi:glycosyltransferase involved in cell wall biosynthesis